MNRDSGSTSSSFSAGGSVDSTRPREDSRFSTSRAFMSASGRPASKTTVTAIRPGSWNSSAADCGCGRAGSAAARRGSAGGGGLIGFVTGAGSAVACTNASTSAVSAERSTSLWPCARRSR